MEWIEYLVRLRFHVRGFDEERLTREYVERVVRGRLSSPLEAQGLMEIMVSEGGCDNLLNIPLRRVELWVGEIGNQILVNVGDPDDARLVDVELQYFEDDEYRFERYRNVREIIINP